MANGQRFNRWALTAASRFLPLNSFCLVTFPKTGRSLKVRITDRGPNPRTHRLLDLSEAAAVALGLKPYGVGRVVLQY